MHATLISSVSRRLISSTGAFCAAMSGGAGSQENRSAPMGTKSDPPPAHTLESHTPQAAEAKPGQRDKAKGKSAHKTEGAGGFDNGLYGAGAGAGAGSNK
ncbi:hypothetical protein PPGU19_059320 [Paraburkholderia sp. PGU19]|uniref:hypothetical protein n=1 Tax=Paraburkholderia sp. PGU19 TaxID=2735434 RepID=UPI0015DA367E|nr:hypothetical protein [Paraburkholderia sp. PGU19]BCG01364.1 hypothetical protein PPGU19_059320 [Paraburkholderia sp. PGU19]